MVRRNATPHQSERCGQALEHIDLDGELIPGFSTTKRSDTGLHLGVVSDSYRVVQNHVARFHEAQQPGPGEHLVGGADADLVAGAVTAGPAGLSFTVFVKDFVPVPGWKGRRKLRVSLPLLGRHNVYAALAAVAVGMVLGVPLEEALEAMGMPIAFSGGADFSGITGNYELFIRDVVFNNTFYLI